jgi:CPA2 family monovalent cation:H+ antiporter-2
LILAANPDAATLLVELGAIILGLAILGRLAAKVGIPSIPLYLIAGLVIGEGGVVDIERARGFIESGAAIGVILLLLVLGLEYTGSELTSALRDHAPSGAVDLVLNFTPGLVVGLILGWDYRAALMLGGITYVSSSGIIAKVLSDLGHTGNRETPVILTILVTEDLVMALYLPLMGGLLIGGEVLNIATEIMIAVVAVLATLVVALRFSSRISEVVFSKSPENLLLTVLGITLLVAGIAELVQASAAVGAFLVGIALSGRTEQGAREVLDPLKDLFAAMFFVFFGLQIDPTDLPPALALATGLAVVTATMKLTTGWWAARRAGISPRGRLRAGATLISHGEFSIVIAGIAVAEEIEPEIGPLAAAYVLILAVAGPLITRAAEPLGRKLFPTPARTHSAPEPR